MKIGEEIRKIIKKTEKSWLQSTDTVGYSRARNRK